MAGEPIVTIVGNATEDAILRFTPAGAAVSNFTVANNTRKYNRDKNEWEEGPTTFMPCTLWRDPAENAAETIEKGMRLIVQGELVTRSWTDKETGQQRSRVELQVLEVGPSLRYATAKVTKTDRRQPGGQQGGWAPQQERPANRQRGGQPDTDPWATHSNAPSYDEPPF